MQGLPRRFGASQFASRKVRRLTGRMRLSYAVTDDLVASFAIPYKMVSTFGGASCLASSALRPQLLHLQTDGVFVSVRPALEPFFGAKLAR
jgi:hydroxymethylglutaryl-CoA reductase